MEGWAAPAPAESSVVLRVLPCCLGQPQTPGETQDEGKCKVMGTSSRASPWGACTCPGALLGKHSLGDVSSQEVVVQLQSLSWAHGTRVI